MRKIAGPGHVSNEFVNYDALTNPSGTQLTDDWCNDVQDELIGVQDEFSIAEAAGTNEYIRAAIIGMAIKYGKKLGEIFFSEEYESPAAFDKDNPEDFNPAVCLSSIEDHLDISATNWPNLVPVLRARPAYYMHNKTGEKYQFDVTNWAIVSNVATLTFANTTAELAILGVLSEDTVAHGGYGNWQTITLPSAIGDIAAGDYAITDVDAASRTISFAYSASDNSGGVTAVASFYRHRVAGSTTTARLFPVDGYAIMSEGSDRVSGFRKLDQLQGHHHSLDLDGGTNGSNFAFASSDANNGIDGDTRVIDHKARDAESDGTNGTPRIGSETRPRNIAAYMYLWGRSYVA